MEEKKVLKFGLKPSKDDSRDHLFSFFEYEKIPLPLQFSLANTKEIEVYDQLNYNSCSANSVSNQIKLSCDDVFVNPSKLFMYFNARVEDLNEDHHSIYINDEGASLRNTYKGIMKFNYLDEKYYGYYEENLNRMPPKEIYRIAQATKRCLISYRKVLPIEYNMKFILYKLKKPIVFGMSVYTNFLNITKNNYILKRPASNDYLLGHHAVLAIGYDDITNCFIILNSHGKDWGLDGCFHMSYEYAKDPTLLFEAWIINS